MRLIVTADDFGLSPAVDEGIIEAFQRGIVRSTAVLTNFPDFGDSADRLKRACGLELGIHLNLTAGRPVLSPELVPTLVGPDGAFQGLVRFLINFRIRRIALPEVIREWAAQIALGQEMGCRFASITSHRHVHMLPALAQIAVELAQRFKIPAVRLSRFHPRSIFSPLRPSALPLVRYAGAVARTLNRYHAVHNDFVVDIPAREKNAALRGFSRMLRCLPSGVFEVVSHPGYVDPTLRERDGLVEQRMVELEVMTAPMLQHLEGDGQIALTTFSEVAAGGG